MAEDEELERRRKLAKEIGEDTADLIAKHGDTYSQDFLVLRTINADGDRSPITSTQLVECMRSPSEKCFEHLSAMFCEVHPEYIFDFAKLHGIDKEDLARAYLTARLATHKWSVRFEDAFEAIK
jgi:hypothetical protein